MEQQLQDQIAQVSAEHDAKHDANSGKLLENLKTIDAQMRAEMANMADAHGAKSDEHAANLKSMEQQLQEQIAQVSAEHDAKHDANSGKLLENLKAMDAQLRSEMSNMADAHGAKSEEHAANLKDVEQQLRDELQRASKQHGEVQADLWTKVNAEGDIRAQEGAVERQVRTKEVQELWTMTENLRRRVEDAEGLTAERSERMREGADVRSRLEELRTQLTESRKEVSTL